MDTKLQWRAHVEEIQRKVTRTVIALSSLGSSTWGIGMLEIRKLYRGVAIPQMLYACSVWSNARATGTPYTKQTLQILRALQARAARAICGAYRATSTVALEVEAFLLLIRRQIEKHNVETLGRLLSSQGAVGTRRAAVAGNEAGVARQMYISPLQVIHHTAASQAKVDLDRQGKIPPFVVQPWCPGPQIYIDESEEASSKLDLEVEKTDNVSIYTDGSSIGGHVGAAAVFPSRGQTRSTYMGTDAISTVYAAELQGINLALSMAQTMTDSSPSNRSIAIWTDNQAAIRSLVRPEGRSGAYILQHLAQRVEALQSQGHTVKVRWIPSHEGIKGNEAVDLAAKEATGWREDGSESPRAEPPDQLYPLRTTFKRCS